MNAEPLGFALPVPPQTYDLRIGGFKHSLFNAPPGRCDIYPIDRRLVIIDFTRTWENKALHFISYIRESDYGDN